MQTRRVTFIGRFPEGDNGIVHSMLLGLKDLQLQVQAIDVARRPGILYDPMGRSGGHGPVHVRLPMIKEEIAAFQPDVILVCAGGLTFSRKHMKALKKMATVVGITLSDPDVFPSVSRYAHLFSCHTTNSVKALKRYRRKGIRNTFLMPFAVDSRFFMPRPKDPRFLADVAVIGHGRQDRLGLAKRLAKRFNARFFGRNWPWKSAGPVFGEDWFRAAYSVRFVVNFPRTFAGYRNVKVGVFEAAATGRLVFTEYLDEMRRYFVYGKEIVGYRDADDLIRKIRYYLDHPGAARRIARAARLRCSRQHTWQKRFQQLFRKIGVA